MPGGDRTGPNGDGPLTGRAAGYCAGLDSPGYLERPWGRVPGRGGGRNRGGRGGNGWRHRHWYRETGLTGWQRAGLAIPPAPGPTAAGPPAPNDELALLRREATRLTAALEGLERRIQQLEGAAEDAD